MLSVELREGEHVRHISTFQVIESNTKTAKLASFRQIDLERNRCLSPILMGAANRAGGGMGKMVAAQSLVTGSSPGF